MHSHESNEIVEQAEGGHAHHGAHAPSSFNKRVALLIAILAALLAIAELGSKSEQNEYLSLHIEQNDLWGFFQAKAMRQSLMDVSADQMELMVNDMPADKAAAINKKVASWREKSSRYESDPATGEGKKELKDKAVQIGKERDLALAAYHNFEFGSAAFQLAIVLASAAVVTGTVALAFTSGAIGLVGLFFCICGWFFPTMLHLA